MQEQKKYHQRKLAIIEMIELCEEYKSGWERFLNDIHTYGLVMENANNQINRYELIKSYLTERYNRQ